MKEVVVISLGGSQIIKEGVINISFLKKFKAIIKKNNPNYKFIIVTGGGAIARIYIKGLREANASEKLQSYAGISITRANARFLSYFFGEDCLEGIPHTMESLKKMLERKSIVFTGALSYKPNQTSDSTSAQIADNVKSKMFINVTNVAGLYTSNPKTNKGAKLIKKISWKEFHKIASKLNFKPGQHFVLDQKASIIIMKKKIKTYIIGNNLMNLDNILNEKEFVGTLICG
ncbi:MAG: UMP kinase [Candidatus Pacearchaeota archaeon]